MKDVGTPRDCSEILAEAMKLAGRVRKANAAPDVRFTEPSSDRIHGGARGVDEVSVLGEHVKQGTWRVAREALEAFARPTETELFVRT